MSSPALIARWREEVDAALDRLLPPEVEEPRDLHRAMRYGVLGGGKRLRPILCLAASHALDGDPRVALRPAVALEVVHAYTLIHDDLPCMDDDDLRRGRPTCHRVFGDALATLAGLSLLVHAFRLLAETPAPRDRLRAMIAALAREAGAAGVVGGQVEDLQGEGREASLDRVRRIHRLKTASLLRASLVLGGLAAGGDGKAMRALDRAGWALGQAFQITDDILGETGTEKELGKPVGADRERGKATMVRALGLEGARREARRLAEEARLHLADLPGDSEPLRHLVDRAVDRSR